MLGDLARVWVGAKRGGGKEREGTERTALK